MGADLLTRVAAFYRGEIGPRDMERQGVCSMQNALATYRSLGLASIRFPPEWQARVLETHARYQEAIVRTGASYDMHEARALLAVGIREQDPGIALLALEEACLRINLGCAYASIKAADAAGLHGMAQLLAELD